MKEIIGTENYGYGELILPDANKAFHFSGPPSPDRYGCHSAAVAMAIKVLGNECDPQDLDRISGRIPNTFTAEEQETKLDFWLADNGYKLELVLPDDHQNSLAETYLQQATENPNVSVTFLEGFSWESFGHDGNKLSSKPMADYMGAACRTKRVSIFSTIGDEGYHSEASFSLESRVVHDNSTRAYRFSPSETGGIVHIDSFAKMATDAIFICGMTLISKEVL